MIDDKVAKMAANTLKMYCQQFDNCGTCAMQENCLISLEARCDRFPISLIRCFPRMNLYKDVGSFINRDISKTPKFDGSLQLSQDFKSYLTTVLDRALADEGIDSQDLVKHGELAVKIKANGLVKVGAQRDGRIKILGTAKCHPNDAFNLETGVRLAVHRMIQDADKPFEQTAGYVYYFVDYDGSIMGKPWNDDVIDNVNRALDNCFKSTFSAWLHITSVKRGIRHLADALRLTLPEPGKASD